MTPWWQVHHTSSVNKALVWFSVQQDRLVLVSYHLSAAAKAEYRLHRVQLLHIMQRLLVIFWASRWCVIFHLSVIVWYQNLRHPCMCSVQAADISWLCHVWWQDKFKTNSVISFCWSWYLDSSINANKFLPIHVVNLFLLDSCYLGIKIKFLA